MRKGIPPFYGPFKTLWPGTGDMFMQEPGHARPYLFHRHGERKAEEIIPTGKADVAFSVLMGRLEVLGPKKRHKGTKSLQYFLGQILDARSSMLDYTDASAFPSKIEYPVSSISSF
jgi:hypothetical protein